MRVLLDNDIVLDFLLERESFFGDAENIFNLVGEEKFLAYIAAITPLNAFYILRKTKGKEIAFNAIENLLKICEVCLVDKHILQTAFSLKIGDYEDAVQCAAAAAENLDAIITRNFADYKNSPITVYAPTEFLQIMQSA